MFLRYINSSVERISLTEECNPLIPCNFLGVQVNSENFLVYDLDF